MSVTRDAWLARHPYLRPLAAIEQLVARAADDLAVPGAAAPRFDDYRGDFHAGIPLLKSASIDVDFRPVEDAVPGLVERLALSDLPDRMMEQCRGLHGDLRRGLAPLAGVLDAPWDREPSAHGHGGLHRYVGWALLVRFLRPVVAGFAAWRDEDRWLRNYCPACGSPPAMGQLVGSDPGRLRLLSCGCCRSRWRYRRTGCPFCDAQDEHRLAVVAVEGESGLRIDYCEGCRGYLKTYEGQGSEELLLADWTSLHLDVVAADRGLERLAASLYEM